jgi:hypothetical protein
MQVFSHTAVEPNTSHWLPLFCPASALACPLRVGDPFDKWNERAIPGINLGFSPLHARSVALILTPLTGYVSPQFHLVFDPTFPTFSDKYGNQPPPSLWQAKCEFTRTSAFILTKMRHHLISLILV